MQIPQTNPDLKRKKFKAIFIGFFFAAAIIIGIYFLTKNQQIFPSPTPAVSLNPPSINPKPGNIEMAGTFNPIILEFSESIKIQEIKISSTPDLKFTTNIQKKEPKKMTLIPEKVWREEAYTIRIEAKFSSNDGSKILNYDRTLKYTILPLPTLYFPVDPEASEEI